MQADRFLGFQCLVTAWISSCVPLTLPVFLSTETADRASALAKPVALELFATTTHLRDAPLFQARTAEAARGF